MAKIDSVISGFIARRLPSVSVKVRILSLRRKFLFRLQCQDRFTQNIYIMMVIRAFLCHTPSS